MSVDVIYQFSDIKGIEDIRRRGITKDLLCHLVAYAKAYSSATSDSNNPLNYMSHSGHLFEVASVQGLMDILATSSHDGAIMFCELAALLGDHTDDMMLAAEANALALFFIEHRQREIEINKLIDRFITTVTKDAELDPQRIEVICRDSLAKNEPEIRIRRLLKSTKK